MKTCSKCWWRTLTVIGLAAATSANAAVQVAFDAADSNIAAGDYDFTLSGITAAPTFDSTFELYNLLPIGNSQNPPVEVSAPSGWVNGPATINLTEWYFQITAGAYNGNFDIKATPNLEGNINWDLAIPGGTSGGGTVFIGAVPESSATGVLAGCAALIPIGFVLLKRKLAARV